MSTTAVSCHSDQLRTFGLVAMEWQDDTFSSIKDNDSLIDERDLCPGAKATLRAHRSIDKMVKSYVRKPVSLARNQPKHLLYKPHTSLSSLSIVSHGSQTDISRDDKAKSAESLHSLTTQFVGIGVGGGEGVALRSDQASSSKSRISTPNASFSVKDAPVIDTVSHECKRPFLAQPNHNNGSPRTPKRKDEYLPIWNDVSSTTEFPPVMGRVEVRGALIPEAVVKDGMIDVVRRHDTRQRKRFQEQEHAQEQAPIMRSSSSGSDAVHFLQKGGFEDSFRSSVDDSEVPTKESQEALLPSKKKEPENKNYMSLTQKSKVSSMIRLEDDYAAKWMKMKRLRDERREREIRRVAGNQLMQSFAQVVYNTDRHELQRALLYKREEESHSNPAHKEEIRIRRRKQEESLRRRLEAERDRKREEVMKIKQAIDASLRISEAVNESILQDKRDKVDRLAFKLDDCSSSIVSVPSELASRLDNAKSLRGYESAKKDIKSYFENTLSTRISTMAKSRDEALAKAQTLGSDRITLSPLKPPERPEPISESKSRSFPSLAEDNKSNSSSTMHKASRQSHRRSLFADDSSDREMTDSIADDASIGESYRSSESRANSHDSILKNKESRRARERRELKDKFRKEELHAASNDKWVKKSAHDLEMKLMNFGVQEKTESRGKFHPDWPKRFQQFSLDRTMSK